MMFLCLALHQMVASVSEGKLSREAHATNGFTGVSPSTLVEQKPPPLNARKLGAAVDHPNLRWPEGKLIYDISGLSNEKQEFFKNAIDLLEEKFKEAGTCVRFEQRTTGYRVIVKSISNQGCNATLGYREDVLRYQIINLDGDVGQGSCWRIGTIWHEVYHALGFIHTHQRLDRDDHVEILEDNIKEDSLRQFSKGDENFSVKNYVDYDFHSLMHYDDKGFSKNKKPTIVTHDGMYQDILGQSSFLGELSKGDLLSMKSHYEHICSKAEGPTPDLGCSNAHCENFINDNGEGNCRIYEDDRDFAFCYMKESTKSKCKIADLFPFEIEKIQGMVISTQACMAGGWENEFCDLIEPTLACARGFKCAPKDKDSEDTVCKKITTTTSPASTSSPAPATTPAQRPKPASTSNPAPEPNPTPEPTDPSSGKCSKWCNKNEADDSDFGCEGRLRGVPLAFCDEPVFVNNCKTTCCAKCESQ